MSARALLGTASYWRIKHRRTLRGAITAGAVTPVAYLVAFGVLFGKLVEPSGTVETRFGSYLEFLVPGLLVATAMQVATTEGMFPVTNALKWDGTYDGMTAAPLSPVGIFGSHLAFVLLRVLESAVLFLVVAAAFGGVASWWSLMTVPVAVLFGGGLAAQMMAYSMLRGEDCSFNPVNRFVVVPLFLFSGIFFAVERLPPVVRVLADVSPLTHAADLSRAISRGELTAGGLGHASYLAAFAGAGVLLARAAYRRRLFR